MDVEILEEALEIAKEKTFVARELVRRGEHSVSAISRALRISRSHLSESSRSACASSTEGSPEAPTNDIALLARIRPLIDLRPTYGYRRVTAILNRQKGGTRVNHKRVYRVMREARLLLPKYGKKPTLRHDGKVITLASDMRRGRDMFEIRCWNGEKIHVGFSLDCCDREVMSWVAADHHLDGEAVRDLMAGAVDVRFGTTVVPKPIEWLSDNGPPFTATKHDASAPTAVSLLRTRRRTRRNLMAWPKPS